MDTIAEESSESSTNPESATRRGEDESGVPNESHSKILARQEQERSEFKKRTERIRSSIPKKDRTGRARAAEDAAEKEKVLLEAQAAERIENGIREEILPGEEGAGVVSTSKPSSGQVDGRGRNESKAARRRRKKAEQEAEAQRRVNAEKASMGPSQKFVEMQSIDSQLKPKKMRIHPIAADGHCLYSAIAHQMTITNFASTTPASVEGLRAATADYLIANKEDYMPFVETVNGDDELFRKYCEDVRNEAVWGGQVELKAIAEILGANIEVYGANMPVVKMGTAVDSAPVLRVSFHRQYFGLGEHYNSVISQSLSNS